MRTSTTTIKKIDNIIITALTDNILLVSNCSYVFFNVIFSNVQLPFNSFHRILKMQFNETHKIIIIEQTNFRDLIICNSQ